MKSIFYSGLLAIIEFLMSLAVYSFMFWNFKTFLHIAFIWFFLSFIFGHYKCQNVLIWVELKAQFMTLITAYVTQISVISQAPKYLLSMAVFDVSMFALTIFVNRTLHILLRNWLGKNTLVIGTDYEAYRLASVAHSNRFALTLVKGFVKWDDEPIYHDEFNEIKEEVPYYEFDEIIDVIHRENIEQVFVAIANGTKEDYDLISRTLFNQVPIIKILPQINFTITFHSEIQDFDGEILISTSKSRLGFIESAIKRVIDVCAGIVGCILLGPLMLIVKCINKKNGDDGPIIFKQERIGKDGKPIQIYKFRSMVPDAEAVLEEMMESDPAIKEEYLTNKKLKDDPRITEAGKFLRKTSLDEFPQFINVLKGEMSLVGPRPYLPREKEDMDIYYDNIIKCKPGITGMWQANGRSDVGFIERCKFDDYYYKNWSIGLDMVILYKTVKGVVYGKGAL